MRGRIVWALTFAVMIVTAWMAYANVFGDMNEFVDKAHEAARAKAGCGKCDPTGARYERGMISQTITYEFARAGTVTVVCRRDAIVFGEYRCAAE
jgi:hypothetical protein